MFTTIKPTDSFHKVFYATVFILLVCGSVLTLLNVSQGLRLRRAEVNVAQVTERPNERLTLYTSRGLSAISKNQVTINPKASFTIVSSGESITLQFTQRLDYNTTYHVSVKGVRSPYSKDSRGSFDYSFKTIDPVIYYIHRRKEVGSSGFYEKKEPDQIMQTTISGGKPKEIYSASRIQEFAVVDNKLAVATINDDKTNSLSLVDITTRKSRAITLPSKGVLSKLRASRDQRSIGFVFTSNEKDYSRRKYQDNLFTYEVSSAQSSAPVKGVDDKLLQIADWCYAPDGTTVLVRISDGSFLLVDTKNKYKSIPLGQFASMENFSYNGAQIAASTGIDSVIIDAVGHTYSVVALQSVGGVRSYPLGLRLLGNSDGYLARLQVYYNDDYSASSDIFLLHSKERNGVVYRADEVDATIDNFSLSPNDQYLVIEKSPMGSGDYDNYAENSKSYSATTDLVDVDTGKIIKNIEGFDVVWGQW